MTSHCTAILYQIMADGNKKYNRYLFWVTIATAGFLFALLVFRFVILPRISFETLGDSGSEYDHEPQKVLKKEKRVNLRMSNVFFRVKKNITMQVDKLEGRLTPTEGYDLVDFDNIDSFRIELYQANVLVYRSSMTELFNRYVFNFKGCPIRNFNLEFTTVPGKGGKQLPRLKSTGEMKLAVELAGMSIGTWIGFETVSTLDIDTSLNQLVMANDSIKSLGNPYTKTMMGILGLELETLVSFPPGRGIQIKENSFYVDPFKIFPPPTLWGQVTEVKLRPKKDGVQLKIRRAEKLDIPPPSTNAPNFVQLYGGTVTFGRLVMYEADLIMVDPDPSDPFDFYLSKYFETMSRGNAQIRTNGSVLATMPDYEDIINQ